MREDAILESRISFYKLYVLCSIIESGGVTRAAEHLHVSQPVVSAHLRDLQTRLHARLCEPDGRGIRLTTEGEVVYDWARETLSRAREMVRLLNGISTGSVGGASVAASMSIGSYVVPGLLTEFRAAYPQAILSLQIGDPEQVLASVESGECDGGILVHDAPPDGVTVELLGHDDLVLLAGATTDFPSSVTAHELTKLPLICAPRGTARQRIVERELALRGLEVGNVVIELGHPEPLKRAARAGLGALLMNRYAVADELTAGTLREIAMSDIRFGLPVYLAYRRQRTFSQLQEQLFAFLRSRIPCQLYSVGADRQSG